MAETLGSSSSSLPGLNDVAAGTEFPRKTAARSTRRVSASAGLMTSLSLASDCVVAGTLHAVLISSQPVSHFVFRSRKNSAVLRILPADPMPPGRLLVQRRLGESAQG